MGKRLKRYFYNELASIWPTLFGIDSTVVLKDGVPIFGKILRKEGEIILIEDKIPRLHRIDVKNIYEIVVDTKADY